MADCPINVIAPHANIWVCSDEIYEQLLHGAAIFCGNGSTVFPAFPVLGPRAIFMRFPALPNYSASHG